VEQLSVLSDEQAAYIELRAKLAAGLRQRRQQKRLLQLDLATKLQSSQSRVSEAKIVKLRKSEPIGVKFKAMMSSDISTGR
jgi:predicted XRE-type DNA-binding protein